MEQDIFRLLTLRIYDNKIEMYDRRKQQIVEVRIIDDLMMCLSCRTDECIHVGYALGVERLRE
ncbi:hypothetical protein Ngar_c11200 [Candidatus Nitrososphaera gargensis Ga9.2]|uniref:Uncharacterized protein n=1 Tax=Nitrososphaera gargensis (strain Ga9.2) TaxID=1237085 RepID=K0IIW0_NITGG|nr:hypothetical protein Ngar_c11200 [Candidatus Nitrososphaera gargensis Ga9.2]